MATLWNDDALFQDAVERLKASLCPAQYPYTHEFLDMAAAAASQESGTQVVNDNVKNGVELAKASVLN